MERLRKVVIREELLALTGDFRLAIVLNQFLYWSERVRDFDKFLAEEKERSSGSAGVDQNNFRNGWIYKSCEELIEECMLVTVNDKGESKNIAKSTMRGYIRKLVENGWLKERSNPDPHHQFDRTMQYRVNLQKIHNDLLELGYTLQGYKFDFLLSGCSKEEPDETPETLYMTDVRKSNIEVRKSKIDVSKSKFEIRDSNLESSKIEHRGDENRTAIPDNTTDITTDITTTTWNDDFPSFGGQNVVVGSEGNINQIRKKIKQIAGVEIQENLLAALARLPTSKAEEIIGAVSQYLETHEVNNIDALFAAGIQNQWQPGKRPRSKVNTEKTKREEKFRYVY